jgi:hypothetical protein
VVIRPNGFPGRLSVYSDDLGEDGSRDDLLAEGLVHSDPANNRWVLEIDESTVRHASDRYKALRFISGPLSFRQNGTLSPERGGFPMDLMRDSSGGSAEPSFVATIASPVDGATLFCPQTGAPVSLQGEVVGTSPP